MRNFKLTLAYDGTGLVGWQRQASGTSVQGLLEDACARLARAPVAVAGAGRTDAGVHAAAQVASAALDTTLDSATLGRALNAHLPAAVRVWRVEEAAPDFHARFSRHRKTYAYRILNGPVANPFRDRYAWHVPRHLSAIAMSDASASLVGTHDFRAFQSAGSETATTLRTVESSRLSVDPIAEHGATVAWDGSWLTYRIVGTGFLRHMVRTIAGTLVEIGSGRADPEIIATLLQTRTRADAGPTAPAHGLCLESVEYF